MKITADTNVLISGSFWYGDSYKLIKKVENREIEPILSKEIIEEFSEVLNYEEIQDKIKDRQTEIARTIEKIVSISTIVEPTEKVDTIKDDPDDNKVLECAIEGKVDFIISQGNHLLKLGEFRWIEIVRPKEILV